MSAFQTATVLYSLPSIFVITSSLVYYHLYNTNKTNSNVTQNRAEPLWKSRFAYPDSNFNGEYHPSIIPCRNKLV